MTEKSVSQQVMQEIAEKKMKPRSRSFFIAKDAAIIVLAGFFLVNVGLSISVVLHRLTISGYDMYFRHGKEPTLFIFSTLPYLWLIAAILFFVLLFFDLKRTKSAYRYRLPVLIGGSLLSCVILGSLFFMLDIGHRTDDAFVRHMPGYETMIEHGRGMWLKPEDGLLAGKILENRDGESLIIIDMHGTEWEVDISNAYISDCDRKALDQGFRAIMIGKSEGSGKFSAEEVRIPPGCFRGKPPGPPPRPMFAPKKILNRDAKSPSGFKTSPPPPGGATESDQPNGTDQPDGPEE